MAKGNHIYVDCGAYTHHGIDCGDGTAIHYIGERLKGVISRTSIASFTSGKKVFVRHYRTPAPQPIRATPTTSTGRIKQNQPQN